MGRRSKADLYDLTERILTLSIKEKLTINQIAEKLQSEDYKISRGAVQRSLKSSKEMAQELLKTREEARVMIDTCRADPNTDVAEAVVDRFTGLLFRESQAVDALEFDDPGEAVLAISRLANAQAKLGSVRMKYQNGFEAAKNAVVKALQKELHANHPDLLESLTTIVASLEAPAA